MNTTRYELQALYDRHTGEKWHWHNLPMNTPIMLVRSGGRPRFKPLTPEGRGMRNNRPEQNTNQLSLLEDTHNAGSKTD